MFQFFRRRDTAVRVFIGAILVLVCVMLVVTLIPGLTDDSASSDEVVLATVGGESITGPEVMRQVQQLARGSRLPRSVLPLYAPQLLNQMVSQKIVLQEARRMGLSVSPDELAAQLTTNAQFFPNGKFIGEEEYRNFIQSRLNLNVAEFEEKYRDSLLVDKLRRVVTSGVTIGPAEVEREYHRRNDKVRFDYVLLKTDDVKSSLQLSDAEIAGSFQKNREGYQVPEKRHFKFVFLDTAKLKDTVTVEEKELQRFYNENKDRYRVADRVKVSHILYKTVGKTPEDVENLRKKAEGTLQRLRKGEDFATLARMDSDDAQTTPKGGDLGWVLRGQTVPEFEKVAFSLDPGSLSDIIKTTYGLHILKVHERDRAHQQTFEEVRAQILPLVKQEKAQVAAEEAARKAENVLKKTPSNFQAVADQLGLQVQDSGPIKRGDPLLMAGTSGPAEDALFASNLKPNGITSALRVPNGVVIASLAQVIPAHPAELAEVRDQVSNALRIEKAGQLTGSRMKDLAEQVRRGGDLKKLAAAQKLAVKTSEFIAGDGNIPDLGAASALGDNAFTMNPGEIGGPVAVTDGQAVFRVVERQQATPQQLAQGKGEIERQLLESKRSTFFELFLDNAKTRMEREGKVKVDKAALDRLAKSVE